MEVERPTHLGIFSIGTESVILAAIRPRTPINVVVVNVAIIHDHMAVTMVLHTMVIIIRVSTDLLRIAGIAHADARTAVWRRRRRRRPSVEHRRVAPRDPQPVQLDRDNVRRT